MRHCLLVLITGAGVLAEDRSEWAKELEVRAAELSRAGEYDQAEQVQRKALQRWEGLAKERTVDLSKPHINLAQIYVAAGKLAAAERHAHVAERLQANEEGSGEERAKVTALLARICFARGDYLQAAGLQDIVVRALETAEALDGDALATALNDLAMIRAAMGELSGSRTLLMRSLGLARTDATRGVVQGNLALVCFRVGDHPAADGFYQEAIANLQRSLGPHHPNLGLLLAERAQLLQKSGRGEEAKSARRKAKEILGAYRAGGVTVDIQDLQR